MREFKRRLCRLEQHNPPQGDAWLPHYPSLSRGEWLRITTGTVADAELASIVRKLSDAELEDMIARVERENGRDIPGFS